MDPRLADLLRELEEAFRQRGEAPRMAREAGQFINLLVKATKAKSVLEVGTADGYAALWLAEAAWANNGRLITVEEDVWQFEVAKQLLARSPHAERINLLQGDPLELLPVIEGPFDFLLLDGEHDQVLHYFRILVEQISSGAIICCNKAISRAGVLSSYLTYVHDRPGLESVVVPIGEGIEITYKAP